ncbi:MAG: hypothetical protein Q9166_005772 [cf. Caloplaca sp. 2 TL-2023]
MSGLEFAAGIGGLTSLSLTLFRGCIQAFETLQSAAHAASEADNFRCKLEIEHSRIIQESNGSIKKLRWAVFDKDKAKRLIDDIIYFNNRLNDLLDSVNQEFVKSALGSVLRDIISRSNATSELEAIKQLLSSSYVSKPAAIASAASLKQIRLVLGLGPDTNEIGAAAQRTPPSGSSPKIKECKPLSLRRGSPESPPKRREIAHYKSNLVMVEWKLVEKEHAKSLKQRIYQIGILLAQASDPSLHSLHCIGILPSHESYQPDNDDFICYGLVFELSILEISPTAPPSAVTTIRPLSELYTEMRKPSLNERRDIAIALAETVLQMHTSGWLHKGIRSENILFFDTGDNTWERGKAAGPYMAGYEFARPMDATTEAMPAVPEQELYQHPKAQGLTRTTFRRSFDLFALGCVLLEVGLWSGLMDVLQRSSSDSEEGLPKNLPEKFVKPSGKVDWARFKHAKSQLLQCENIETRQDLADIAFHAGTTFQEVILLCLYARDESTADEDISVEKEVVDLLRQSRF